MVTTKHTSRHESARDGTIGIRMRIERELHTRLERLRDAFPVAVELNEVARKCLKIGIEAEELGGTTPMLDSRIEEKVKEVVGQAIKELEERLLTASDKRTIRTKKGRGKPAPK